MKLLAMGSFYLICSLQALSATSETSIAELNKKEVESRDISLSVSLISASTTATDDSGTRDVISSLWLQPEWKISNSYIFDSKLIGYQELNEGHETSLRNSAFSLRHGDFSLGSGLNLGLAAIWVAPTNSTSYKMDGFRSAFKGATHLSLTAGSVNAFYDLSLATSVYRSKFNSDSTPNNAVVLSNWIGVIISLIPDLSFASSFVVNANTHYAGGPSSDLLFAEELTYQFNSSLSALIGFGDAGDAVTADGSDWNTAFYDDKTKYVYIGMSYSF